MRPLPRYEIHVRDILSTAFLGAFSGTLAAARVVEAVLRGKLRD